MFDVPEELVMVRPERAPADVFTAADVAPILEFKEALP
jgi:hypothetical protein